MPVFNDLIKAGTVKVYEGDGRGRAFGSYGHGAQRAIQMAMVRHLADLKRGDVAAGGVTLLLVDEPELFMHPFAVEQVREALRALSEAGYQVVFSTHSAQMILAKDAKNALLMTKKHPEGTKARPRMQSVVEQLVENPTHQLQQLFGLTNSSQILFSDKVVLTEGRQSFVCCRPSSSWWRKDHGAVIVGDRCNEWCFGYPQVNRSTVRPWFAFVCHRGLGFCFPPSYKAWLSAGR